MERIYCAGLGSTASVTAPLAVLHTDHDAWPNSLEGGNLGTGYGQGSWEFGAPLKGSRLLQPSRGQS